MTPRISVVIPCWNDGQYLDEAVDSVFAQTRQDFDIVIVDDGSTDAATVEKLARYDRPRTTVVHQENRGLPAARNTGIRRSGAPYICALDADDRLAPTWFEKAAAVLEGDPGTAFASHWLKTFGDEEWEWTPESCELPALLARNTVNGAALVRRDAWLAVGGFDETFTSGCEDWDFWLTLVERGFRGTIIPEILFYYRRRADSMSRVMFGRDQYMDVFRTLMLKHRASYLRHASMLIARRDADMARMRRDCEDLHLEYATWLRPVVQAHREAIDRLRPRVDALVAEQHRAAERERLQGELSSARGQISVMEHELASAQQEIAASHQAIASLHQQIASSHQEIAASQQEIASLHGEIVSFHRGVASLRAEVAGLRQSWSWRITAPLRAASGWLLRLRGRQ